MYNNYARIGLLFILFVVLTDKGFAQCSVPIVVDLSGHADTTYTQPGSSRSGNCCGGTNCISYKVLINPQTDVLAITSGQFAASDKYYLDCAGPYNVNQSACISGKSSVIITFCKPGNNAIDITFTTTTGISTSPDMNLRQGCTGSMSVTGLQTSTITWTSIYPGTQGAYNSYLSQTSGVSTVNVTPGASSPAYIDYQVTGIEQSPCSTLTKSDTVRVYTYAPLTVSLASSNPTICSGGSVTLTATPSGGKPAYSYLWSNGATTPSISVSTAGTYSVSINDQSDQSAAAGCGAMSQSINMTVTTPVAPTAPPVTICTGNTATLNAIAPGGPYHWYDVNHNLVCNCTSSSITTPVLTSSTTYYVSTTLGGCQSPETAIPVTVSPLPPTPSVVSQ
ncbi:hypothetical protein [Mucilaginibacter sp. BT774]|uniref:immunoglobulin domain-containing protein n=1 Tax=Mucilaginibacter sp. BT774 TaxID=3062276 RepID=UPI00267693E4|nr:hypothetical protein [Mucilaginibacter sp. BT774]MDO3626441.1 hypothetical protein [Mucilaginibacter sp. BT774]